MLIESNQESIEIGENEQINIVISEIENDEWYSDVIYYLENLTCPDHLVDQKRRTLRLKAMNCYRTVCRKGPKSLSQGLETGVTGASPPTVTSMGSSFYLGGQVQGRRP
jgi:hypothetical protein